MTLAGCTKAGDIMEGGISAVRSACPRVGVAAGTGDITLFNPAGSTDASALDVTATMTNLQSTCNEAGEQIMTDVTFDVLASRPQPGAARDVSLPYYIAIVRGGSSVTAKQIGRVTVHFDSGQTRAQATGRATSNIDRAAATLPEETRKRLTERRKAGEDAAAIDPLADPAVRQAVLAASFEALVGFQLTEDQLRYNVTR